MWCHLWIEATPLVPYKVIPTWSLCNRLPLSFYRSSCIKQVNRQRNLLLILHNQFCLRRIVFWTVGSHNEKAYQRDSGFSAGVIITLERESGFQLWASRGIPEKCRHTLLHYCFLRDSPCERKGRSPMWFWRSSVYFPCFIIQLHCLWDHALWVEGRKLEMPSDGLVSFKVWLEAANTIPASFSKTTSRKANGPFSWVKKARLNTYHRCSGTTFRISEIFICIDN